MSDALFPAEPHRVPLPPKPQKLSAGRRLTLRQQRDIQRGWHPLSHVAGPKGLRLAPAGTGTCGDCVFRQPADHGSYPKCLAGAYEEHGVNSEGRAYTRTRHPRVRSSAATDCRKGWPACTTYEPREARDG